MTQVKRNTKDKVFLEAIKINGTVLPLAKNNIKVNLSYFKNNSKPILWENCEVKLSKDNQENFYFVFPGNLNGKLHNRRKAFRVKIDLDSEIFFNNNFYKSNIYDLSCSGFSFITNEEVPFKKGDVVGIRFDDKDLDVNMKLVGKIVRTEELDKGTLDGCSLVQEFANLEQYLSSKQREFLVKNSGLQGHRLI